MIEIVSFGVLHAAERTLPEFTAMIDLQRRLRDPHIDPALREMTGLDPAVVEKVLSTPGARQLIASIAGLALRLTLPKEPTCIGISCRGGRHRSVVVANRVYEMLISIGEAASVLHCDVDRPVVTRSKETVQ